MGLPIGRKTLEDQIDQFLETRDDSIDNEWYCTEYEVSKDILKEFVDWLYHDEEAKAKRKALYELLKQEFGDESSQLSAQR